MQIFYSGPVTGGTALFSRRESDHCLRVLRMQQGEMITFTDGRGSLYEGIITGGRPGGPAMSVTVISQREDHLPRNYRLHIAISPLKGDDRLEWFIEKAVELGVDTIIPLICSRSVKRRIRRERLTEIMIAAMKQSGRCLLPQLNEPVPFSTLISEERRGKKIIATCDESLRRIAIGEAFGRGDEVTILIGPEGDFTAEEVEEAVMAGWQTVHIGAGRLRTETAGITACCAVVLANL